MGKQKMSRIVTFQLPLKHSYVPKSPNYLYLNYTFETI